MHESFFKAINPKPSHVCLRLPLKPLTLGHLFYLQEIGSPVVSGSPESFGEILTAVIICAQPCESARKMLNRSFWLEVFARYWGWRCQKCELIEEASKFRSYLKDEQQMPPLQKPEGKGRDICAPWEWVLLDFLRSTYRMSKSQAMGTEVRSANVLWSVHWNFDGRVSLATANAVNENVIGGIWRRIREAQKN